MQFITLSAHPSYVLTRFGVIISSQDVNIGISLQVASGRLDTHLMVNLAVLGPKRCIKCKSGGLGFVGYNSISRPHRGLVQEAYDASLMVLLLLVL